MHTVCTAATIGPSPERSSFNIALANAHVIQSRDGSKELLDIIQ